MIVSWGGLVTCGLFPPIFHGAVLVVFQSLLLKSSCHQSLRLPKNSTQVAKSSGRYYWMLAIHFSEERVTSTVVSIYPLATSIGGLVGSKHSKFCGYSLFMVDNCPSFIIHRWPSAQLSMVPVMILGSFGVAGAQTVLQLMFWRIIQGMGASPSLSIGAGVTGDIYGLERQRFGSGGIFRTMFCLITHTLLVMASHSITPLLLSHLALFSTFYPSSLRQAILEPGELISTRNLGEYYSSGGPWSWTPCPNCLIFVVLPS